MRKDEDIALFVIKSHFEGVFAAYKDAHLVSRILWFPVYLFFKLVWWLFNTKIMKEISEGYRK